MNFILSTVPSVEQADPVQKIAQAESVLADTLNQASQNFPADYFKNLADSTKAVSDILFTLTNSTLDLIDAQRQLKETFTNSPQNDTQLQPLPTDGFMHLSTATNTLTQEQDALIRKTRELESLPVPQKDSGLQLGFDMDTAGTVLGLGAMFAGIGGAPLILPVALGITAASGLAGLVKGSFDATADEADNRLSPYAQVDLSGIITPLSAIDQNVATILDDLQNQSDTNLGDVLSEHFGSLPNIESYTQEILQSMQELALPAETIITPLNTIAGLVAEIANSLSNREPRSVVVSPNLAIDLGGAYVFDDALKKSLVDDITSRIVTAIKDAVQQATSRSSFGYGA